MDIIYMDLDKDSKLVKQKNATKFLNPVRQYKLKFVYYKQVKIGYLIMIHMSTTLQSFRIIL